MKKRIVLLGPPASGKGTQAEMIQARFHIDPTSPGAMLREELRAGTALGKKADLYTSQGGLVPDSMVLALVEKWLEAHDSQFVFDGFPRTLVQGEALETLLQSRNTPLDIVFFFDVSIETIRERILQRVTCEQCGRSFGSGLHGFSVGDKCPVCAGQLIRRKDDTLVSLERRMAEYREKTEPLVDFYRERGLLRELPASDRPEVIFAEISTTLEAA